MNLILLEESDFLGNDRVRIDGRRFLHIRDVHRARAGDELTVGRLGGRIGFGRIVHLDAESLEMEVRLERDPPAPLPLTVVLALPRPKVMRRVLRSLAVMGVKKIVLVNSARLEKSYWQTPFLDKEEQRRQLLLGLEQAGDTVLPDVQLRRLFRPFVEDELPELSQGTLRFVAHPGSDSTCPRDVRRPVTLVIGPEGGFVPFEIDLFLSIGFTVVSLGPRIMNIETAIPFFISRLF
jgi:RsmE family RNA methyltransferase